MISIENQQRLLNVIGSELKKRIEVYAVGGTAMMFHGIKDATLDIDLVFKDISAKEVFKKAIKSIGYQEFNPTMVYGGKDNPPEMFSLGDERFDLFVRDVIDFTFSDDMIKRAVDTHEFGSNLVLKIADVHDIILMKCATERQKDLDDAKKIILQYKIDWNILLKEAENQIALGRNTAAVNLGYFLEKLRNMKVAIPQDVLDSLATILEKQAKNLRS